MKIVVYDSGVGGRVIFDLLKEKLDKGHPEHDSGSIQIDYFSDNSNFPYGTKSEEELQRIVLSNFQMFKHAGYDHIVVACNTASGIIDDILHKNPHAKTGNVHTIIRPTIDHILEQDIEHLYIIGSKYTINNKLYSRALHSMKVSFQIIEKAEQELIVAIEEKNEKIIEQYIQRIITEVPNNSYLLLACTHYSIVKDVFEEEIKKQEKNISIIDPSEVLVKNLSIKV